MLFTIDTMVTRDRARVRVLYSFAHKLGAGRICNTAWQQVAGIAAAGADVILFVGSVLKQVIAPNVETHTTLAHGRLRIPYRLLGTVGSSALHDYIVASQLEQYRDRIDIIHAWPLGARRTLKRAAALGIPTVLERPNTHTAYAYKVVQDECDRIGVRLQPGTEHTYQSDVLRIENEEYQLADYLLCPSEFVARTFVDAGYSRDQLARHRYGYDPQVFFPDAQKRVTRFTALFAGMCAVRKGLHFALEAWLDSEAHIDGEFLVAGAFAPEYAQTLAPMLAHPSVRILGQRDDVPELMRRSDILVLPSLEEGSALVAAEARGSGCVLLVSDAAGAVCSHMHDALVHRAGDVRTLTEHLNRVYRDRALLERLRVSSLSTVHEITWEAAGKRLLAIYADAIQAQRLQPLG